MFAGDAKIASQPTVAQSTLRVSLYGRVSTHRQEQEATIESQIAEIEKYARSQGYEIVERYMDNGYSGDTLIRPDLDRLRDDARAPGRPWTILLVHEKSRTARRYLYRELVEDDLRKAGVTIIYVTQPAQIETAEDKLFDGMQGLINEYERAKIIERMRRGKRHKIEQGHMWRCPYGYRYVKPTGDQKHGHIEIVEHQATVMRDVFAWVASGRSSYWVANELNRRGIPSPTGRSPWRDGVVRALLHNPIFGGEAAWFRVRTCEPANPRKHYRQLRKSSYRQRPEDEWERVAAPKIVEPAVQAAAQATLARGKKTSTGNTKHAYLLAGLLRCGNVNPETGDLCFRAFNSTAPRRHRPEIARIHRCTRHLDLPDGERGHCTNRIKAHVAEPLVWDALKEVMQHPDVLEERMREMNTGDDGVTTRVQADLATARASIEATQSKLDRLLDLHLDGVLDADTYTRRQGALVAERTVAGAQVVELETRLRRMADSEVNWGDARAFCQRIAAKLDALDAPEAFARRRLLIQTLLTDIVVYPDALELRGALPGTPGPHSMRADGGKNVQSSLDVLDIDVDILDFHADHVPHSGGDGVLDGGPGADHVDALCDDDVEFNAHRILAHGQAHAARGVMAPRE